MQVKPIKTETDHQASLVRIKTLWDAEPNTSAGDELEVLVALVHAFEELHYPIEASDPIEAIKFRMEQQGLDDKDLVEFLVTSSLVTEVLQRRRRLTITMIRNLHKGLRIPLDCLIQDYQLVK